MAIKEVLSEFRNILLGRIINIYTDHLNFTHERFADPTLMRWRLQIEQFSPDIVYLKGEDNVVADSLSRLAIADQVFEDDFMANIFDLHCGEFFQLRFGDHAPLPTT